MLLGKKGKGKGGGKGGKKAKGGQANSAEEAEWFYDEENDRWWRQDPSEDFEWDCEDDSDDEQAFSCFDKAFIYGHGSRTEDAASTAASNQLSASTPNFFSDGMAPTHTTGTTTTKVCI